ncbi:hypothetical protein BDQ12DRAFT_561205, partial [Crucibulum laeve]
MVIRDVITRWNFTHAMIRRALVLRKSIDTWVFENLQLRPLFLQQHEWDMLEQLADILE